MSTNEEIAAALYGVTPAKTEAPTTPLPSNPRADALYGTPAKSTTPVNSPADELHPDGQSTAAAENPTAESLYEPDHAPKNPYSLDDPESLEGRLGYADTERVELRDDLDLSPIYESEHDQTALRDNLSFIGASVGANQEQMHSLVESCNEYLVTGGEPPAQRETLKTLYEVHGSTLNSKLADARELLGSFPDLQAWLESSGAGDSPEIILKVIQLTQTPKAQARLETLRNK